MAIIQRIVQFRCKQRDLYLTVTCVNLWYDPFPCQGSEGGRERAAAAVIIYSNAAKLARAIPSSMCVCVYYSNTPLTRTANLLLIERQSSEALPIHY